MKRFNTLAVILGIAVLLGGCGGRTIDEALLPTRVPLLNAEDFAVTATPTTAPTSTPIPAPDTPTPLPVIELATTEPTDTGTAVPAAAATEAMTPTIEAGSTAAPEETATAVPAAAATETMTPTIEAESTVTPEKTATAKPAAAVTASASPTSKAGLLVPTTTPVPTAKPTQASTASPTAAPTDDQAASASSKEADPVLAGLSENMLAAMAIADPARGEQLTLTNGCIGCHSLNPNQVMAGPTWRNVGKTAAARVAGQSAALYIYNSILHPNDFVVETYMPNIMLQIYEQTLSDQDLADIIAYLLSQQTS